MVRLACLAFCGATLLAHTSPEASPAAVATGSRGHQAIDATLADIELPPGFRITLFALVPGARDLAVSPNGRKLFVGTMDSDVYAVDLLAPSEPVATTFAPKIPKRMAHGVCFAPDGTLFLAEQNRILAFPDAALHTGEAAPPMRVVVPQGALIPPERESLYHSMRVCRIGPDGKLYVTIGQPHNVSPPEDNAAYARLGMGAIVRMDQDGSHREIYALGIRNSVGLDFSPTDRTLWFTDNQVDHMGDDVPPGEINRATRPGQNFGFPWYGGGHVRTPQWAKSIPPTDLVFPEVETVAHAADLGMTFYRGVTFPKAYQNGIFSAQHGSWDRTTPVGARVMFTSIGADGHAAAPAMPFAEGWLAPDGSYRGRPVDIAETADGSLLVSDDLTGAVYRIRYEGAVARLRPGRTSPPLPVTRWHRS